MAISMRSEVGTRVMEKAITYLTDSKLCLRRLLRLNREAPQPAIELRRVFRGTRHQIDVEALVRVMVFNRLCDPESRLGVLRWLETVALPDRLAGSTHQHLLRRMDALMQLRHAVDRVVARLLRPLIDQDLTVQPRPALGLVRFIPAGANSPVCVTLRGAEPRSSGIREPPDGLPMIH